MRKYREDIARASPFDVRMYRLARILNNSFFYTVQEELILQI